MSVHLDATYLSCGLMETGIGRCSVGAEGKKNRTGVGQIWGGSRREQARTPDDVTESGRRRGQNMLPRLLERENARALGTGPHREGMRTGSQGERSIYE